MTSQGSIQSIGTSSVCYGFGGQRNPSGTGNWRKLWSGNRTWRITGQRGYSVQEQSMSNGAEVWRYMACFGQNRFPCLVSNLRAKTLSLSPLGLTLAVEFCQCPLSGWGSSFLFLVWQVFYLFVYLFVPSWKGGEFLSFFSTEMTIWFCSLSY